MAYTQKTWYNKGSQNRTPANATNMNDLEKRIFNGFNSVFETAERLTNCNDATSPGVYQYISTTANIPPIFTYGNIIVTKSIVGTGNTYITQLALGNDGSVATRGKVGDGAWSAWRKNGDFVLYESSSGTTGSVTLTESVEKFNYLEIFGQEVGGRDIYTKVWKNGTFVGKRFILGGMLVATNDTNFFARSAVYTISSATKIEVKENDKSGQMNLSTTPAINYTDTPSIKIYKVIGKY